MENVDSIGISNEDDDRVTRAQFGDKFAVLREEATQRTMQYRQRLQRAAEASTLSEGPQSLVRNVPPPPLHAAPQDRNSSQQGPSSITTPFIEASEPSQHHVRQDFDLIALWSVVGPSTITAVFAGVAMASGNVPLPYAIAFIFAWFVLTSALAIGALRLFNTKECAALLRASGPRLGIAAISCALIAVLAVEAARLSITAMAGPAPQQVGSKPSTITPPALSALAEKTPVRTAVRKRQVARAQSVHFPSTSGVISEAGSLPKPAVSTDETITSLPKPIPQSSLEPSQTVAPASPRRARDKLLGSISSKGKFLTRRSSSRWSGSNRRTAAKRKSPTPDTRNILERIFKPIINSANAKAPSGRVGTSSEDMTGISR